MIYHVSRSGNGRNFAVREDAPTDVRMLKYYTPIEAPSAADAIAIFTGTELAPGEPLKTGKAPKLPPYGTIAVRFIYGRRPETKYVYRVRAKNLAKLHLGQEIIAPAGDHPAIAVVVEIHKTPQDTVPGIAYKFATGTIASF